MKKKTRFIIGSVATIFTALALFSGCGSNDISRSSQVLARVGDKEITTTYFERQLTNLPESVQKLATRGHGKKAILEAFVERELLYAAARKKKLDKDADLARRAEDLKKELVVNAYLQNELVAKIKVDDKEVESFYNANPAEYKNRQEVRISQIVVPDDTKAAEIYTKLGIRRNFGDLAANYSTDKTSRARKGDVGWFTFDRLPREVRDGVFNLRIGEVSKAYKTADGYEIYRITDRRTVSYPFDSVKEAIKVRLFNDKLQEELRTLVDGLKKTTTVQMNEALIQ